MAADRPEPMVFTAWLRALNRTLYADELGPLFREYWDLRPRVVRRMLGVRTEWCDVALTAPRMSPLVGAVVTSGAAPSTNDVAQLSENTGCAPSSSCRSVSALAVGFMAVPSATVAN